MCSDCASYFSWDQWVNDSSIPEHLELRRQKVDPLKKMAGLQQIEAVMAVAEKMNIYEGALTLMVGSYMELQLRHPKVIRRDLQRNPYKMSFQYLYCAIVNQSRLQSY
jgi:hypothetical protein